eukprot:3480583-Prymnesium_polylepis.1
MPEFERAPRAADRARPCSSGESGPLEPRLPWLLARVYGFSGAKSRTWTHVLSHRDRSALGHYTSCTEHRVQTKAQRRAGCGGAGCKPRRAPAFALA